MDTLLKDLRYGVRSLLRQPSFTVVAVLTLGLGIGANTAIFSVINALVLTPPSISEPQRVVAIWETTTEKRVEGYFSYLDLVDYNFRNRSFETIAGYKSNGFVVSENGDAQRIEGMRVTANFLPLLRVSPIRGRNFQPDEERADSQRVALLSYDYWQSRFGGAENVIGQQISLNDESHTIIGVLPQHFEFPLSVKDPAVWTTVAGETSNLKQRGAHVLLGIGRLKPGVTEQAAQLDLENIAASLSTEYPRSNAKITAYLRSAHEQLVGRDMRQALWLLLGAVAFILLAPRCGESRRWKWICNDNNAARWCCGEME